MFVRSRTSSIFSLGTKGKGISAAPEGAHFLAYGAPKSSDRAKYCEARQTAPDREDF
jgi:hypothetical protein